MSGITTFQGGQSDLELAACDSAVLLAPFVGTSPLTDLEDATNGGLDATKIGAGSPFIPVGNYEKKAGVKLSNKPTLNKIMSAGKGSPTRLLYSEAEKSITYSPQEVNLLNLQNAWGFAASAVSEPSTQGGITIGIPELPENLLWRCILLSWDSYNGHDIFKYWIANKVAVGDRTDINLVDSDVIVPGVTLEFLNDNAVGLPVIFGICGQGWVDLNATNNTGLLPAITGITVTPSTASVTAATGASHTKQLTVKDSNSEDRTTQATYTSSDQTVATVSSGGLITGVTAGSATVTATYQGFTATCNVTVT